MTLEIRLFAGLQKYVKEACGGDPFEVTVNDPTTVSVLLKMLGIPEAEAFLTLVNGSAQPHTAMLQDGDRVGIFPAIGGG